MKYRLIKSLQLCLITNIKNQTLPEYKEFLLKAINGGVTMIQLRQKDMNNPEIKHWAIEIQKTIKPLGVPLIINDNVELAAEINADGIHIGPNDMHPNEARKILGPNKIIGLSIESFDELNVANNLTSLSYVTASAVFPSFTKPDCKKIWGLDDLKIFTRKSRYPTTAIGGITNMNASSIIQAGAKGVAVIGAIHDAKDPFEASFNLKQAISQMRQL
jgi:thiamine-phosphate pyrophosphorylase